MSTVELIRERLGLSSEERSVVLDTLGAVLESPHFCKSKRYPALLEYAVRAALDHRHDALKERTIGVEVFGRPADYDTAIDPVVRITAAEVRRRTCLYFSEHPEAPVRIDLPLGSYLAEFHFKPLPMNGPSFEDQQREGSLEHLNGHRPADMVKLRAHEMNLALSGQGPRVARRPWAGRLRLGVAAALLVSIAGAGWWLHLRRDRERREFWWPVLTTDKPALILVGGGRANAPEPNAAGEQSQPSSSSVVSSPGSFQSVALDDAVLTAQVCGAFREQRHTCTVTEASQARVEDLRGKSVVLIGGFNNPWTHRLLTPLTYQLEMNKVSQPVPVRTRLVVEQESTGNVPLVSLGDQDPSASRTRDYAIVARFHSDITDSMAVVVAGLGPQGTKSAGEYISSTEKLREILSRAPKGWNGINFEAVLQVDVIQGSVGHTQVIATRFW